MEPGCCEDAKGFLRYFETVGDPAGPEKPGWAIPSGASEEAWNTTYVNVNFCPFCGTSLGVKG